MSGDERSVHDAAPGQGSAANGPAIVEMGGSRMELVVRFGPPAGDIVLFRVRLEPNRMVPLHSHADPEASTF